MGTFKTIEYRGGTREASVPDTLDLADRAELAINGLGGSIDPNLRYQMHFYINYNCKTPYMKHHGADVTCDPKFAESFPLMRLMCGSDLYLDIEQEQRAELLSRIQDGLYWNFVDPARPWRDSYNPAFDGNRKDEDVANVGGNGRMLRTLVTWYELVPDEILEAYIRQLVDGLNRIAVHREDYAYFPDGGFGEAFNYPRSGWINTDEAKGEVEGAEGSATGYQAHQIQGLARWYALSGDIKALELAEKLTRYCMMTRFWGGLPYPKQGDRGPAWHIADVLPDPMCVAGCEQGHWYSHFHARAIVLRGILEYGRVANDSRIVEFVRRAYEYALTFGIPRMGWINCYPAAINRMEACALGDLVALGVRLSDIGAGDYWDDVDCVVRNQLVETQLIRADVLHSVAEASPVKGSEHVPFQETVYPNQINQENVIERTLGTFGSISSPASLAPPWVMQCCTGNATQGLYYAWEAIVRETDRRAQVNLLLNRASKSVDIDSFLPYEGKVVIHVKQARRVSVRIPSWVDRTAIQADVDGNVRPCEWVGNYLVFDDLESGSRINIRFPITQTTSSYTVNARTDDQQKYTCTFRGNTLVDIQPRDNAATSYPLYLRDHLRTGEAPLRKAARFVPEKLISRW